MPKSDPIRLFVTLVTMQQENVCAVIDFSFTNINIQQEQKEFYFFQLEKPWAKREKEKSKLQELLSCKALT